MICAIVTALISVLLLIFYFIKRKDDEDDEQESKRNNKLGMRLLGLIPAIAGVVAFILTEDMSLKMRMTDKWTIVMVIILAIEALVAVLSKKTTDDEDKEGEAAKA